MDLVFILLWVIATLTTGLVSVWLGKKYGVAFPIAIMACLLVLAGATVNKIVIIGPYTASAAVIVFSMTFLMTDMISEIWGKRYAQMAVWAGFYANLMLLIVTQITIAWPAAVFAAESAAAFESLYGTTPRLVLAGMVTYLISQHLDIYIFHAVKKITGDKRLWLRNNLSTIISQLVDTVLIAVLAFAGAFPLIPFIIGSWLIKIAIAFIDTPFIYAGKYLGKRFDASN